MAWFKKLFGKGEKAGEVEPRDRDGVYVYVKCQRCGAPVMVRADKRFDFERNLETGGYIWRKEIMDGTCFQLIYAEIEFDAAFHVVRESIQGGERITWETYQALTKRPTGIQ